MTRRRVTLALAAACLAAGCTSASYSQPVPPIAPHALPDQEGAALSAGTVTKTDFRPQPVFRLGPGWHMGHDIAGFFDVQRHPNTPDVIAVQFAQVFNATTPAAVIHQLRRNKGLRVSDRGRTTVAGLPASEVQIDSRNPHLKPAKYTAMFSVAAGSLYIGSGRRMLVDFIQRPGGLVAVLVGGSVRNWAATLRAAQPVVTSIRFR